MRILGHMVPGIELRLERVANRVRQIDVAREMGVTPGRVSHIEATALVPTATAERYRAALRRVLERRTCRTA